MSDRLRNENGSSGSTKGKKQSVESVWKGCSGTGFSVDRNKKGQNKGRGCSIKGKKSERNSRRRWRVIEGEATAARHRIMCLGFLGIKWTPVSFWGGRKCREKGKPWWRRVVFGVLGNKGWWVEF